MPALSINLSNAGFASFLSKPVTQISTDLRNANTIRVLEAYEQFKRKANPNYTLSPEKYSIRKIQEQFGVELMPQQINDEFWQHFIMFLLQEGVKGSTIKTYCHGIVASLKWGVRHRLEVSPTYDCFDTTQCKYEKTKVVLTPDDVSLIAHFDLNTIPYEEGDYRELSTKIVEGKCKRELHKLSQKKDHLEEQLSLDITEIRKLKIPASDKKLLICKKREKYKAKLKDIQDQQKIYDGTNPVTINAMIEQTELNHQNIAWAQHQRYIQTLSKVRDLFVLQCNFGQRYSDICRIEPSCFSADKNTYTCVQQKTGNRAVVDIKQFAFDKNVVREILERYNYHAPYTATIGRFNRNLHQILRYIGGRFNETVKTENKIRGKIVTEELPKWKAIASHTARRSFVSYNVKRGKIEASIRRCTGHLDERSFQRYLIYEEDE